MPTKTSDAEEEETEIERPRYVDSRLKEEILERMKAKSIKPDYRCRETLDYLFNEEGLTQRETGELLRVDEHTIWRWAKRLKVRVRNYLESYVYAHPELKAINIKESGLWLVRDSEKRSMFYNVDLNAKTCTCNKFKNQGIKCEHIEGAEGEFERRQQVEKEQRKEYHERHKSYPEYMEKCRQSWRKRRMALNEAYERFKIEFGGKCKFCGESDLDVIEPHHPKGRGQTDVTFKRSKEFLKWVRYGIKPEVELICTKCHRKINLGKINLNEL